MNFLQAAREEQEVVEEEEEMVVEQVSVGRRKKPKVNAYDFFQEMRGISVRPLDSDAA